MKKIKLTFIFMILVTAVSNVLGLVRELVLAYKYGTSEIVDIFIISTNIPITLFSIFMSAVVTAYIPISSKFEKDEEVHEFTSNLLNLTLVFTCVIFAFLFIFVEEIVKLYALGFSKNNLELTVELTKIMLLGVFPMAIYLVIQNYLNLKEKFIGTALIGVILNISWILGILFSAKDNLIPMGIGNLLGYLSVAIFLLYLAFKNGYQYKLVFNIKDDKIQTVYKMFFPIFIGLLVTQVNVIVERALASLGEEGAIAILNYSSRLMYMIYGLLIITFLTYINPRMATLFNENKLSFRERSTNIINLLLIVILPIVFSIVLFAEDIIDVIFNRGEFDSNDIHSTALCLKYYIICLIPFGIRELLNKLFYIAGNTILPLVNNSIFVGLNVILSLIAIVVFELDFVALSLTSSVANCVALFIFLFNANKKNIIKFNSNFSKEFTYIVFLNVLNFIVIKYALIKFNNLYIMYSIYFILYTVLIFIFNKRIGLKNKRDMIKIV